MEESYTLFPMPYEVVFFCIQWFLDFYNLETTFFFPQVKVAIYNNGVEKANIVFNAIGANKDSWFDKSRIISSTYTDIQNAPKEFFSMIGYIFHFIFTIITSFENLRFFLQLPVLTEYKYHRNCLI